nr:aminotransferase class V-fold PLP-dependent enzyme [Saccharopolyspora hordei]
MRTTPARLRRFVMHHHGPHTGRPRGESEWRREARLAAIALAPLIGAAPKEITVGESTSINLFKALLAASRLRPGRPILAVGRDCFAADRFLAQSAADFIGGRLHLFSDLSELAELPSDQVAVVALSHTDLRTGAVRDSAAITAEIHRRGALALWDLSHSAGALDVDLHGWQADFAIGCGHKYLGGGAGAPAYSFVADRHRDAFPVCTTAGVLHPLAAGFTGSASTLSVSELRTGLSILTGIAVEDLAAKTASLVELFLDRLDDYCADTGLEVVRPSGPTGAQVILRHERAQHLADALFDRDVLVELPRPDVLRMNFAPSWIRYVDVWEAAERLHAALHDVG